MTKEEFIKLVSKIDTTFEDEFKSEYNSPELIWNKLCERPHSKKVDFLKNKKNENKGNKGQE